jgi:hypothetical protein
VHVSENRVIVSKIILKLTINILENIDIYIFVVYGNGNLPMHHIPSCIMSSYIVLSCIMLYHQHKSYGIYVLCKESWGKVQHDYMDKKTL